MRQRTILSQYTFGLILSCFVVPSIYAQSHYSQDRYEYCRQRAQEISDYYGPTPKEYREGGALKGAFKGVAIGAAFAWLGDKNTKKAAKRGAALGAIIGAVQRGAAKSEEKRKRKAYEFEVRSCMSAPRQH